MIRLAVGSVAAIRDGAVCFEKRDIWFDPELNLILPEPSDTSGITVETTDCTGRYIMPGLFDSHIHGCYGTDISDASSEDIVKMSQQLAACGVSAFLPTTMTMSEEAIRKAASETGRIVTVEEHSRFGGLGAMVCETISEQPVPVRLLGIPDENVVHGTNAEIFHHYGLDAEGIVKSVLGLINSQP